MGVIKIKLIALIITIEQVSKLILTAIVMQVEEVVALIAVVALQAVHVQQEFHKPMLKAYII
ncbi:MAG: hypothetical protein EB092_08910 [Chitinophagia bacterium]|nr:hypothetical protein [Chitinophagia bacterium]